MKVDEWLMKGTIWVMTVVGVAFVIAGFILIQFYARVSLNQWRQVSYALYSLLYWVIGFELLFIAAIFERMSDWFVRQFRRLAKNVVA